MALFTEKAVKERLKARVAIDGPTGSGKTWTALQLATILAMRADGSRAPIGCIDTENRSAAYYAPTPGVEYTRLQPWDPPYDFDHFKATAPYDPRLLGKQMDAAEEDLGEDGVLVIDSLTHYYAGEGGTLDIVDDAGSRAHGNKFAGWKEGTPAQRYMLDRIVHAPYHVIVTMRSKMEWVLDVGANGKTTPRKVGMAPEQRAGIEYEFTCVIDMDLEHRLVVTKSRCDSVADLVLPKGRSSEFGLRFGEWLGSGVARVSQEAAGELVGLLNGIADKDARTSVKNAFVGEFGAPAELLASRYDEARQWIVQATLPPSDEQANEPPVEPELHGPLADAIAETVTS